MKYLAALLLFFTSIAASSNSIPQKQEPNGGTKQWCGNTPHDITRNSPPFEIDLNPENCEKEAEYKKTAESHSENISGFFSGPKFTDYIVAVATLVIAIAAFLQYLWTRKMVVLANRPKIVVRNVRLEDAGNTVSIATSDSEVEYTIHNEGGTRAIIKAIKVRLVDLDPGRAGALPYEDTERANTSELILKPGGYTVLTAPWEGNQTLLSAHWSATRGKRILILFGSISYRDDTGAEGCEYFKWRWDPNSHCFMSYEQGA